MLTILSTQYNQPADETTIDYSYATGTLKSRDAFNVSDVKVVWYKNGTLQSRRTNLIQIERTRLLWQAKHDKSVFHSRTVISHSRAVIS